MSDKKIAEFCRNAIFLEFPARRRQTLESDVGRHSIAAVAVLVVHVVLTVLVVLVVGPWLPGGGGMVMATGKETRLKTATTTTEGSRRAVSVAVVVAGLAGVAVKHDNAARCGGARGTGSAESIASTLNNEIS